MSDKVITQDPALPKAADAFVDEMQRNHDGEINGTPLWTQWALRHAFERGVAWQLKKFNAT